MQLSKRDPDDHADKGLKRDVEALLFASGKHVAVETLTTAVSHVRPVDAGRLRAALYELENEYGPDRNRGFELVQLAGGWTFRTNAKCGPVLDAMFVAEEEREVSTASLEALAIVA